MLRPGITVPKSMICCGQARFGCGGCAQVGFRHHDSFPFTLGRGRQRSSKNALADCVAVKAMSRKMATKLERDFMRAPPSLRLGEEKSAQIPTLSLTEERGQSDEDSNQRRHRVDECGDRDEPFDR